MFETLVTRLLTSALGNYVDARCFSSDKINVAVWSGYVVLRELEVKPDVLDHPSLRLVRGMCGSIELKIPWNRLQSDSVVATVDDVYLLVETQADVEAVMRQMDAFTIKKRILEALYTQAKQQQEEQDAADGADNGFAARLINKIIDNVELHIRRIHVRIEDHHAGDHPFAVGVAIESVHVQSTNSNWQPSYVDTSVNNEPRIFKIVELNHLSVYLNPDCEVLRDHKVDFATCSLSEFSSAFSRSIPKRFDDRHFQHLQLYPSHQQHHFLLKPIDASARLIVNRDVSDSGMPKVEVDVNIPEVAFRLEESQYCDLLYLASTLQAPDHYAKYQQYRKFRPQSPVFDAKPGEWWRYAMNAVVVDVRDKQQRWSWSYMKERRHDRKKYVTLWTQKAKCNLDQDRDPGVFSDGEDDVTEHDDDGLDTNGDQEFSPRSDTGSATSPYRMAELEIALQDIEKRRPVEDILFFRYLADLEIAELVRMARPRSALVPPLHPPVSSDTESVDTEVTGSSGPTEEKYRTWGAWMFGWTSKLAESPSVTEQDGAPRRVIPDVELRELFKILEYEPSKRSKKRQHQKSNGTKDDVTQFSDENSQGEANEVFRVTVTLQRGSITLASDPETKRTLQRDDPSYGRKYSPTDFLLGTFSQLQIAGVARDDTMVFDVSLQSIEAFDESAESSSFSRLLSRKQTIRPGADNDENSVNKLSGVVFLMSFETNPANSNADAALFVHMEPLEIVLSPTARCWGRLSSFLDTPKELGLWAELEVASFNDIVNLKARTEAKLNYVMANRVAVSVDLRIQAPVIIIPESDTDYNCSRLVIDLGHISFRTDRLSQLDSDTMNFLPPSTASSGRGMSALALMTPGSPTLSSSTSFVRQLYDEADRGEGAIRWKEEFYDKFSLSITNVHVLLVPYGKTSRSTTGGGFSSGIAYPSVSLPPYYHDIYDQEHEHELVERFSINVTVRTSILPLDATLTRLFVHADLPALTFNMSVDKYYLLVSLLDRFTVAVASSSSEPAQSELMPGERLGGFTREPEDWQASVLGGASSALTSTSLRRFMLDDGDLSVSQRGARAVDLDNASVSDGESSVESDDTWFSMTSGNADWNGGAAASTPAAENTGRDGGLALSDLLDPGSMLSPEESSLPPRPGSSLRRQTRAYTSSASTELIDRRLFVCTITVPLVSIKLRKPRSASFVPYASYDFDESTNVDEDNGENGTILIKLQGFRARVGQKTLSTQLSVSLLSLEVEDNIDETGRTAQYLLFSCPTIATPFSMTEPLRRGAKFPSYSSFRARPRKQRERVISIQRTDQRSQSDAHGRVASAPDQLLELAFSSVSDQQTGREALRDLDVQLGSVQLLFDQSYVCSLIELFEDSSSHAAASLGALVPVSTRGFSAAEGAMDDGIPPLELTPTIKDEYKLPVSLTESVQADLERARQDLYARTHESEAKQTSDSALMLPALKINVRVHSVSVCLSDRGDPIASIAVLRSECRLSLAGQHRVTMAGSLGDVKVFDLATRRRDGDGESSGYSRSRDIAPVAPTFKEIFGHVEASKGGHPTNGAPTLVSFECSIIQNAFSDEGQPSSEESTTTERSTVTATVEPARLAFSPDFIESVATFVLDGPLRAHFRSRAAVQDEEVKRQRAESMSSSEDLAFSSPTLNGLDLEPEVSTPFFDAVDSSSKANGSARALPKLQQSPEPSPDNRQEDKPARDSRGGDEAKSPALGIFDQADFELTLMHPCIVFPSFCYSPSDNLAKQDNSDGIEVDFGVLSAKVKQSSTAVSESCVLSIGLRVSDLGVSSLPHRSLILEPLSFDVQAAKPAGGDAGSQKTSELGVAISPICLNLSDANVCKLLDVYYGSVLPVQDVVTEIQQQLGREHADDAPQWLDEALEVSESGDKTSPLGTGVWSLRCSLDEFKILMLSSSDAHNSFEAWMKQVVLDSEDSSSVRDSIGGSTFTGIQLGSPRRRQYSRDEDPWQKPEMVPFQEDQVAVGQVALTSLQVHLVVGLGGHHIAADGTTFRCDFSLKEASICDRVADQSEYLTHLVGLVPDAPVLRDVEHATLFALASDLNSPESLVEQPQVMGTLVVHSGSDQDDATVSADQHHLDVLVSSARFMLLPRTALRLEHFALDVYAAASQKWIQLQRDQDSMMESKPSRLGKADFLDSALEMDELRGMQSEARFGARVHRSRIDSLTDSLMDEMSIVKSAFMSPLQRMLSTASARDSRVVTNPPETIVEKAHSSDQDSSTSDVHADGPVHVAKRPMPVMKIDIELANVELWVISTDRKADAAGCMLSTTINIGVDTSPMADSDTETGVTCERLVTAFLSLANVEVQMDSPLGSIERASAILRNANFPWTLVEQFDVDATLQLDRCFQQDESSESGSDHELSENKSSGALLKLKSKSNAASGFLRDVPSEWEEWLACAPSVRVDEIVSRVSYRDMPLLLKIAVGLNDVVKAEERLRRMVDANPTLASEQEDWDFFPETPRDNSRHGPDDFEETASTVESGSDAQALPTRLQGSMHLGGLQFRFINNIVDQESPVVGVRTQAIDVAARFDSTASMEVSANCTLEAWYHNLRLVASEPLVEPWSVGVNLSRKLGLPSVGGDSGGVGEGPSRSSAWELKVTSKESLQLNLTDAFVANLTAANRAWSWVVNEGGDPREIREYSTYWIRNNTGLPMQYWNASHRPRSLAAGGEEPLRFGDFDERGNRGSQSHHGHERELFIAVEEEYPSDALTNDRKRWQSETPIPVDQVDSRMYALVDNEADFASTIMRKCEVVIDVVVERGCKFFVVRSTLLMENKTASDLEVEFVPPQRRAGAAAWRSGSHQGHVIPIWKTVVKAASVVPVPVHLVSLGEGYVLVRPPDYNTTDSGSSRSLLPKAYAKERVHLPVFDRPSSSANEGNASTDDSGATQYSIKFHRLFSDRPVRPFVMMGSISSASGALYHRTLSFHPPLILHNLTAGLLDFSLSTPSDWMPTVESESVTSSGVNMGWESTQQRVRERGTINVADSLIWHLSDGETPLELRIRMQGFDWSEPLVLDGRMSVMSRIAMKDVVTDALLYVTVEIIMSEGRCREILLYVPYWIVNLTGLKLEYEFDEERTGHEHSTMLLAGQKRLDRDELLLKEMRRINYSRRAPNPLLVNADFSGQQSLKDTPRKDTRQLDQPRDGRRRVNEPGDERKRRHPCLLPSVPPVKGLLDLLPKSVDDSKSLGQLEVLQACYSDHRSEKGCVRLRVTEDGGGLLADASDSTQRRWSDPFVLDQTGTVGEIEAEDFGVDRKYSIGYSITPAKGQYSRTKVIMLTPRFMLVNSMGCPIQVCHSSAKVITPSAIEVGGPTDQLQNASVMPGMNSVLLLDADGYADFHWTLRFAKSRTIRCRIAEFGWTWSGAVPLTESGEYVVRVRHESTRENKLVRITLKLDSSCICATFREESTTAPPYRIENYSLETLRIHQYRVRRSEILLPHHSLDYAWDEPTEERLLVVDMLPSAAGDNSRPLRIGMFTLDKIQQYPDALSGSLGIEILADGPTRVLRFTDTRLRGEQGDNNLTRQGEVPIDREEREGFLSRFVASPTLHAVIQLQGIGISIVDGVPKELLYVSVSNIVVELLMSDEDKEKSAAYAEDSGAAMSRLERESHARIVACRLQVGDLQIDNQLQMTPYPVLLRFSNPYSRSRIMHGQTTNSPALQLTLVKHDEYAGIDFIRHFSAVMLPVHVRIDGSLLYELLPLVNHGNAYGATSSKNNTARPTVAVGVDHGGDLTRHARNQPLLLDYNLSLQVPVQILEAAHKDGTTSAGPSTAPNTPAVRKQPGMRRKPSGLVSDIQRYSAAAKHSTLHQKRNANVDKKLYFEEFLIGAIRATVSFSFGASAGAMVDGHVASLSGVLADSSRDATSVPVGPLRLILNAIGTSLSKIANAPFSLNALHIHNSFVQPDALATRLASHYQSEALRQAYVILGSVDVLGNPMIAWRNLRGGFQDFIYEPAHGITQSPQAFAFGMGRGTLSLVRASVYTFLDFNTRILSAFSLGLSDACLKLDDYTGYPATRNIFQGVAQGISGVVVAPIHSVEAHGVRGVFPGLMAGAFGLVLKPLLGLSLVTATTTATLRDAIDPNTKALLVRVRPPRHIDLRTKRLKVYSYVESLGEEMVRKIRGGRYRADGYLGHVDLKQKCLLVTKKRILFLDVKASGNKYEVEWELLAEEVIMVDCRKTLGEQTVTIFYMEDEFKSGSGSGAMSGSSSSGGVGPHGRRTPGLPKGMLLKKHVVSLPDSKTLFVRAMLQQQERSLLTKMNSAISSDQTHPQTSHGSMASVAKAATMERSWSQAQQYRLPPSFPIFRLPSTMQLTRSSSNLSQLAQDEEDHEQDELQDHDAQHE